MRHSGVQAWHTDLTCFCFSSIWKSFVPFHSYQVFQRGGYYSVEVIPDSVAVISLNTMYFFDSNKGPSHAYPLPKVRSADFPTYNGFTHSIHLFTMPTQLWEGVRPATPGTLGTSNLIGWRCN